MIKTKRTSKAQAVRLNEIELTLINKYLKENNYNSLRDYLNNSIVSIYTQIAIDKIKEMKKSLSTH